MKYNVHSTLQLVELLQYQGEKTVIRINEEEIANGWEWVIPQKREKCLARVLGSPPC